ncbi:MAG: DUF5615 family PIN-like protein [Candidatus Lokiarchaeota archaeon]|nr:DUF5615 family PIN-like protein [Candidatus Lokiarchaeota archaeon]
MDENVPRALCTFLKQEGHQCTTLSKIKKTGIKNGELAKYAIETESIVITCDDDFLSLKKQLQEKARIIYVDIHPRDPEKIIQLIQLHIKSCISQLKRPGKAILTQEGCAFKKPLEK